MKNLSPRLICTFSTCAVMATLLRPVEAAPTIKIVNPDLTAGQSIPEEANHDWNLGATGARGWMYSEKLTTLKARQIAITMVHPGSPADGVLQIGDVILGVSGKPFSYDPRAELGKALTQAETRAGKGRLSMTRWRDGKQQEVTLELPVLGSYSATAPYDCEKSNRILEQGCEALAEWIPNTRNRGNAMIRSLNALALLASGEEKYLPLIKEEAQWAAEFKAERFTTWFYGHAIIFLSEYVIATGDTSVMPGLERLVLESVKGQSLVGSWGHRFAKPNGILRGYGMMHAPGVPMTTGLVLAREAGVDDPKLDEAIKRSVRLIRFYVGKGTLPYGDHTPWLKTHDNNGKNGMAAVLFNLLGDREAAEYFSHTSVASHGSERDNGHTGNFTNIMWAMPSINPLGPNATGAWMHEFGGWYFDLARQWDGTFRHQGQPKARRDKFANWNTTGANLLAYAMPLQKLRITGKGKQILPPISAGQAKALIEDGRGWNSLDQTGFYDALSTDQLLNRLNSWSPTVRERAAMALSGRKAKVLPELIELLKSNALYAQYGACQTLRLIEVDRASAVDPLIQALEAQDLWLRVLAARALAGIGGQANSAIPAILTRVAVGPTSDDPRAMEQRYLLGTLFNQRNGLLAHSIEGVDRKLLLDAVRAGLVNEDGGTRGNIGSIYDKLSLDEIRPLLPAIREAIAEPAPSGVMFSSAVRNEGLRILAKHNVEEGIKVGIDYLSEDWKKWGSVGRVRSILGSLIAYGGNAKRIIPQLERVADQMAIVDADKPEDARNRRDRLVREAIEKIRVSTDKPEMIKINQPAVNK